MTQLEELKQEWQIIDSNIKRVDKFVKENENNDWTPDSSQVFGELKHRLKAFKRSILLVTEMSTQDLFSEKQFDKIITNETILSLHK